MAYDKLAVRPLPAQKPAVRPLKSATTLAAGKLPGRMRYLQGPYQGASPGIGKPSAWKQRIKHIQNRKNKVHLETPR